MSDQIIPVDPDNARTLARHATEIRRLGKRVIGDVIEIGRLLVESKELVGHGDWLPWLSREFQWSDTTAERFMRVHKLSLKNGNLPNLDIPLSGLYLLAAPSTPEEAKQEAVSRAEAGEPITVNTVKEIVGRAKQDDRRDARADTKTQPRRDAGRAKQPHQPYAEHWVPDGLIETRVIWPIKSAQHHLEDAMRAVKEFKPRMSEADMHAVGNAFLDVSKLTYRGADVEEPTK